MPPFAASSMRVMYSLCTAAMSMVTDDGARAGVRRPWKAHATWRLFARGYVLCTVYSLLIFQHARLSRGLAMLWLIISNVLLSICMVLQAVTSRSSLSLVARRLVARLGWLLQWLHLQLALSDEFIQFQLLFRSQWFHFPELTAKTIALRREPLSQLNTLVRRSGLRYVYVLTVIVVLAPL